MSKYLSDKYQPLEAYTPGEQPRDMRYVKLNTNESPYPPAPGVAEAAAKEAARAQLYSDPVCADLRDALARRYGFGPGAACPPYSRRSATASTRSTRRCMASRRSPCR